MYGKGGFQNPNPIGRYAIGNRGRPACDADGSLDIYMQAEAPGKDGESNRLPAPKDAPFEPAMRLYSPRAEVLDGSRAPQPFTKVNLGRMTSG